MINMTQENKCCCRCECGTKAGGKKILRITWQRLVTDGNTCPRCGSTEDELEKAVGQLKGKLASSGVDVILKKTELSLAEFKKDPVSSNRIQINGRLLEDIIGAGTGQSQCCDACGDEECRTVEIKGESYETIPAEIIVRAGLIVAAELDVSGHG